jgi:broad specificity phosphatase PhoE
VGAHTGAGEAGGQGAEMAKERPEKQVVVVTHAGFLHWLTQDTVQFDNAEWRTYTFAGDGENDEEARLTQIEKDGEIEKFRI